MQRLVRPLPYSPPTAVEFSKSSSWSTHGLEAAQNYASRKPFMQPRAEPRAVIKGPERSVAVALNQIFLECWESGLKFARSFRWFVCSQIKYWSSVNHHYSRSSSKTGIFQKVNVYCKRGGSHRTSLEWFMEPPSQTASRLFKKLLSWLFLLHSLSILFPFSDWYRC